MSYSIAKSVGVRKGDDGRWRAVVYSCANNDYPREFNESVWPKYGFDTEEDAHGWLLREIAWHEIQGEVGLYGTYIDGLRSGKWKSNAWDRAWRERERYEDDSLTGEQQLEACHNHIKYLEVPLAKDFMKWLTGSAGYGNELKAQMVLLGLEFEKSDNHGIIFADKSRSTSLLIIRKHFSSWDEVREFVNKGEKK